MEPPSSLFNTMAALQNYGGWRDGKTSMLKKGEALYKEWGSAGAKKDKKAGDLEELLLKPGGGLAAIFDQCLAVSLLVRKAPSVEVCYLPKVKGKWMSVLCRGRGVHLGTAEIDTIATRHRDVSFMPDPRGACAMFNKARQIELPGNPIVDALAEGKPINQANALLHCRSELVMVNDMNQGADMEQWFFLPQLLAEFHTDGKGSYNPASRQTIVGFKENIFTDKDGLVGRSGALNEFTFGTLIQRELHVTLASRLHYGHPDLFSFNFALINGGTSKCSKTVHVSEDIFGGINVLSRGGKVNYVDYMQVDKGRDVQYDAALGFEGKISGGTSVHTLSRDFFRLMGSPLTFFHRVSLFSGAFGYFWSNLMLAIAVLVLSALHGVVACLSRREPVPHLLGHAVVRAAHQPRVRLPAGARRAVRQRARHQADDRRRRHGHLAIPLTLAKLKCHQYYAHRGLALGLAKYVPTGRDLATKRFSFTNAFQRYAISHFGPALDVIVLLLIFMRFNALGDTFYWKSALSLWIAAVSWLFAPAIYNPFAFTLAGVRADMREWTNWLHSEKFDDFFYGQKAEAMTGELNQNNWYSWMNVEPLGHRIIHSVARLFIYGTICLLILRRTIYMPSVSVGTLSSAHPMLEGVSALCLLGLILYASRVDRGIVRLLLCYFIILFVFIAALVLSHFDIVGAMWSLSLCLYTLGKASLAFLELCIIVGAAVPLWSDDWRAAPFKTTSQRASSANLLLPRRCTFLASSSLPLSIARLHAELLGLIFMGLSALIAGILTLPLSVVIGGLLLVTTGHLAGVLVDSGETGVTLSSFGMTVLLLIMFCALWASLSGHKPRERKKSLFSVIHFQLATIRLNSLHDWLIMNVSLARCMAERAAQTKQA